jgi:hypothetical protein
MKTAATFSMKNGRENRNNGNQEKGKEEKETLSKVQYQGNRGRSRASPKFFVPEIVQRKLTS